MAVAQLPKQKRLIHEPDITCPAGHVARCGMAVFCGIERQEIVANENTTVLQRLCLGDPGVNGGYLQCSTWRAEREREWAHRRKALIEE